MVSHAGQKPRILRGGRRPWGPGKTWPKEGERGRRGVESEQRGQRWACGHGNLPPPDLVPAPICALKVRGWAWRGRPFPEPHTSHGSYPL